MQVGYITHPEITEDKSMHISMSFIDYAEAGSSTAQETLVYWSRTKDTPFGSFTIKSSSSKNIVLHSKVVSLLSTIAKKAGTEVLDSPVSLIREIRKRIARHVVYSPTTKCYVKVSTKKNNKDTWEAVYPEGEDPVCTVEAEDEIDAKKSIGRSLLDTSVSTADNAVTAELDLIAWIGEGMPVRQVTGEAAEAHPIQAYSVNLKTKEPKEEPTTPTE